MMRIACFVLLVLFGMAPMARAQDGAIGLSLPDTSGMAGDTLVLAVHVDSSLTGRGVLAYRVQFTYNANALAVLGVETDGTLSGDWGSFSSRVDSMTNRYNAVVAASGAAATPLEGTGDLFHVRVRLKQQTTASLSFSDAEANVLNEGRPALAFTNGRVSIAARPVLSVSPGDYELVRGETYTYRASGGTEPYTWTPADAGIATIDADGVVTAVAPGQTTMIAEDPDGYRGMASVTVRGFRLSAPDTASYPAQIVEWPVHTTDLTGLGVLAGSMRLTYNASLTLLGVETGGTLLEGAEVLMQTASNAATLSFASNTVIEGAGPLLRLRFEVTGTGGSTTLGFDEILFNEDLPGLSQNGRFSITPLPTVSLSPSSAILLAGETAAFAATGTTGPVTWSVSNPAKASIDADGVLTALQGGTVEVTATDSIGAARSATVTIYDLDLQIPDGTVLAGDTLLVPIEVSNLPAAEDLLAFDMTFSFDANQLDLIDATTDGAGTDGWTLVPHRPAVGRYRLVAAGSTPVTTDGPLFYLRVVPDPDLTTQRSSDVRFEAVLLNEGTPNARTTQGRMTLLPAGTNQPPSVAGALPDREVEVGFAAFDAADLDTVFTDPDLPDDALAYQATASTDVVQATLNGSILRLAPGSGEGGTAVVTVTATDQDDAAVQASFTVTVIGSTAVPVFTSTAVTGATVGTAYRYTATTTDDDDDALTLTAPTLPAWLTFTDHGDGTGTLEGTPNAAGEVEVVLETTDGTYTVQQSFTITVTETLSAAPVFTSTPSTEVAPGVTYTYEITATDDDGDALTLTAPTLPAWLALTDNGDGTGLLEGTTGTEGDFEVVLEVTDGTHVAQQTFTVTAIGSNTPPVFTSTTITEATVGTAYSYTAAVTDADDDALTLTASTLPAWLTFTDHGDGTGTLEGTPDAAGEVEVVLEATDGEATVQQDVTITVSEGTGTGEAGRDVPRAFSLAQNYPNPFNPVTTVAYTLPESAAVRLVIYDTLGQLVRTLVNASQAAGIHTAAFEADDLPSGLYFYRIEAGSFAQTRTMVLLK